MPRSRKRSALKDTASAENDADKIGKIGEVYRNWLAGVASQRKMLEQRFDEYKTEKIREINQIIFKLPRDVANMTVEDFLKTGGIHQDQEKDHQVAEEPTDEEKSLEEGPMETDNVVCTVNQALMDLQKQTSVSEIETKQRPTRRRAKEAPPKTTRKGKKPDNLVTETPLNTGPAPVTWKDTPFISLTRPRTCGEGSEPESRVLTEAEARAASLKLVCMTADGNQVMYRPRNSAVKEEFEKSVQVLQNLMRSDTFGNQ